MLSHLWFSCKSWCSYISISDRQWICCWGPFFLPWLQDGVLVHSLPYGAMSKRGHIYINQWPVTGESIELVGHDGSALENPRKRIPKPWQPHANCTLRDPFSKGSFISSQSCGSKWEWWTQIHICTLQQGVAINRKFVTFFKLLFNATFVIIKSIIMIYCMVTWKSSK